MKYAIVETGSKQYRVEPDAVLEVERTQLSEDKKEVVLDRVLLFHDGKETQVGTPFLPGARVVCEFLEEFRTPKVISYKYKPKKASARKRGHRQNLFRLKVKEIVTANS